jgi:hypothetical protein
MTKFESRWNNQYGQLVEFKRKNGHCLVPFRYQEDPSLGMWVVTQRQSHGKNKLRLDHKELLDEIGFAWNVKQTWHQQYEKLAEFKRKNGHCLVPFRYQEDPSLGNWVYKQRKLHSKNKLRLDHKDLLDELGFVWNAEDHQWHLQYKKLIEFKRKNGNCLVPKRYQEDASLGTWVSQQRHRHSKNKLPLHRKKILDKIGFVWKAGAVASRSSTTNVR